MAQKVKIELMTDDDHQIVHQLPTLDEIPEAGRPTETASAWAKATAIGAPKKKTPKPGEEFPPTWGTEHTPMAQAANASLGVTEKLKGASAALRARGHNILALGTDALGHVLPDSAAGIANAGLLAYGAKGAMQGETGGVPEEEPVSEAAPVAPEIPTPPPAPKLAVPEQAPIAAGQATATFAYDWPEAGGPQYHVAGGPYDGSTVSAAKLKTLGIPVPEPMGRVESPAQAKTAARLREQYLNNRNDPRDLRNKPGDLYPAQGVPPGPTAETKSPVRQALDAAKKPAALAAGATALGAASAQASDPEYLAKEAQLIAAMKAAGHPIMKVGGDRTAAQQATLFAKGPTVTEKSGTPGDESRHQLGLAGDFAFVGADGKPDWNPTLPWATLGRMAKAQGLEWGGDWTSPADPGHVQMPLPPAPAPETSTPETSTPGTSTPSSGVVVEPMDAGDHQIAKTAPELPMWRQILDPIAESLPLVGGAGGGIVGVTLATPTGPAGMALAATGAAYTGGVIGEGLRQRYRQITGQDLPKTGVQTLDQMSEAGRSQMYQEMLGLGLSGALARRAATKVLTGAKGAAAASEKYGLKLSAADLSNSIVGRGLAKAMTYVSATAKAATDKAREAGEASAVKAMRAALDNLSVFHSNLETGQDIQLGIRAGASGLKEGPIGQLYQQTKSAGADVDLRPHIKELLDTFSREGTPTAARRALLKLLPKPTNTLTAPARWSSPDPYLVTFEQAAKLRTRLGTQGRKALSVMGTDATSLATKLYGELSDTLERANPDFMSASNLWRDARQSISQRFVANALKTAPDQIVKALGPTPSVQTVDALRKTMLNLAQSAGPYTPEGAAGAQGFQALRRSWFETHILKNAAGEVDPAGMVTRMTKANGALSGFFGINSGDVHGQQVLTSAREIANALNRRISIPGLKGEVLGRGAELIGLLDTATRVGVGAGLQAVAGAELLPGLVTWAMHQPAVAKALVTGLTDPNTIRGTALLGRTIAGYLAAGGPEADPEDPSPDPQNLPPWTPPPTPGAPVGPQSRMAPNPRDPMQGAPTNIHTFDPESVTARATTPPSPGFVPSPGTAIPQPPEAPSAWRKAEKISASPIDAAETARRASEAWSQTPPALVKAVGDKIRAWGQSVGGFTQGTEDWILASLGGAFLGGTEGAATTLEQNLTPEAVAMGMAPLHDVDKLAELTRSLGASAEGVPGTYSRLTRAVEGLQANKLGMVKPKQVLDAIKTASGDEAAWKGIAPFIREHMQANGEQAPIAKQAVLDHLAKKKIHLVARTSGEVSPPLAMGDPVPVPASDDARNLPHAERHANSLTSRGSVPHDAEQVTRVPILDPQTGERIGLAHWYKRPDGYAVPERPWRADVPKGLVAPGTRPSYTLPEHANILYGSGMADFATEAEAQAWVEARLHQGRLIPDNEAKWDTYAVPGMGGGNRVNYRETKITMPGGEGEGQNPDLHPDAFRADIHYADPNILSTVRKQDYTLRPGEAEIPEEAGPQKGILIDELQSDVHEEAKRHYDKELDRLRSAEAARMVIKAKGRMTQTQALREIPKRAFAKRHYEIQDQDGRSFGQRFLHEEDATRWLDAEKDNFPNATVVPSKGVDPLHGYQKIKASDPQVQALRAEIQAATDHESQWSEEVDRAQANLTTQQNIARDRITREKGYEGGWQELNDLRYQSRDPRYAQARADLITILTEIEKDPTYLSANAAQKEAAKQYTNARRAVGDLESKFQALGVKTGNFNLGGEHAVPDMPFKDPGDWSSLGLKHTLLEAAQDPEVSFVGHVGGKEHADRYGLQNHFSKVRFDPEEESLIVYGMNGRELQRYDLGTATPEISDLSPYMGEEVAARLKEKIDNYEPQRVIDEDGEPGTERERERADEEDYQNGWDQEYQYQRDRHTVEDFEAPVINEDTQEPSVDEDGEPITETRWRVYEDDDFDAEDDSTWKEFETEREADRYLERRLDSIMDGYEHEYSESRYDHLDKPESSEFDESAHPVVSGLDLVAGGEGMLTFYDEQTKRRMEALLKPFGGGEMLRVPIPGQSSRSAYAWIAKLTPEMKEQILKAGFSLMGLALALRDSNAPQPVKDRVMRAAALATRKSQSSAPRKAGVR